MVAIADAHPSTFPSHGRRSSVHAGHAETTPSQSDPPVPASTGARTARSARAVRRPRGLRTKTPRRCHVDSVLNKATQNPAPLPRPAAGAPRRNARPLSNQPYPPATKVHERRSHGTDTSPTNQPHAVAAAKHSATAHPHQIAPPTTATSGTHTNDGPPTKGT